MSPEMKLMLQTVIDDLLKMPKEEFDALLESHRGGDIACALRELNGFVDRIESENDE